MPDDKERKPYELSDDELLTEILDFQTESFSWDQDNRREGDLDMVALSVIGPWPPAELEARQTKGQERPCGHTDIITPFNSRIINQGKMNPRGIDVIPKGDGSSKETAEKRENRIRGIDYESHATSADLTMLECAVNRGIGYERVDVEFESPRSRNLKIVVKRVANPSSCLDDPECQEADRSDRKRFIIGSWIRKSSAKTKWPSLKDLTSFPPDQLSAASAWIRTDYLFFAEYWRVWEIPQTVLFIDDSPNGIFESEIEKKFGKGAKRDGNAIMRDNQVLAMIDGDRPSVSRKVCQYFTNGLQIFERKEWLGTTIPFPVTLGPEKYEGDVLVRESATRKLRQPQLSFDVVRATEEESWLMAPKSKWLISDRAILGYETQYDTANRNPQSRLLWHELDAETGQPNTKPERIDYAPDVQAFEIAANSYIRDAQNVSGMTGVDQKQRQSESGVAQDKIDEAADLSNYHYHDSWIRAIEFRGRIENELLPLIEDSTRSVGFRSKDGKYKVEPMQPMQLEDGTIHHPYGSSDPESHGSTISTGQSYQSQKQKAQEVLETLVKNPDFVTNPLAPLIIRGLDLGPTGEKMEKVAIAVQPPAVAAIYAEDEDDAQPVPPQATQAIQKARSDLQALDAHAKALEQQVIELTDDLKAQKIQAESKERIAQEDNQTKIKLQSMDDATKLALANFDLQLERIALDRDKFKAEIAMNTKNMELGSKENMQGRQHSHESVNKDADRQQAQELADQAAATADANGNGTQE